MNVDFLPQRVDLCTPRTVYGTVSMAQTSTPGEYAFEESLTTIYSAGGVLLRAQAGVLYVLDVLDFRLDRVDETNYLNSVFSRDPAFANKGVAGLTLFWEGDQSSSQAQIYTVPLARYARNSPLRIFTMPPNAEGVADLKFRMDGFLSSVYWEPPLSPLPALVDAFIDVRLFEVRDAEFIKRYNTEGIGGAGLCRGGV